MKSALWSTFTDIENVGIELESLASLVSYLLSELLDKAEAVDENAVRAIYFSEIAQTFCTMLFAVHTAIETQIKALDQKVTEGYELVGAMKREGQE